MRPLTFVALGLALVAIDIRTEHLDVLPDALGWGLVASGAWRLSLTVPAVAAAVTALLALPEVSLPHRFVVLDPETGERITTRPGVDLAYPEHLVFDDLAGWRLATRAAAWERADTAKQIRWLRWLTLGLWTGPFLVVLAVSASAEDGSFDPVWNGNLELPAMAAVAVVGVVAAVLLRETNRAWAVPGWSADAPSRRLRPAPPRRDGRRPA